MARIQLELPDPFPWRTEVTVQEQHLIGFMDYGTRKVVPVPAGFRKRFEEGPQA